MKNGFSLFELIVSVGIIALLATILIASSTWITASFENSCTSAAIDSAISSARALAIKHRQYAGIRFQVDSTGKQRAVLILSDPNLTSTELQSNPGIAFRAVSGIKPISLGNQTYISNIPVTKL